MAKESNRGRGGSGRGKGGDRGGSGNSGNRHGGGRPPASSGGAEAPKKAVPANWPPQITYLTTPVYAGISARQRQLLQTQPADLPHAPASTRPLSEVPSILRFGPSPLVEIRAIADPSHPACGQRGLFAARNLTPGSFILPYLGVYHRGNVSVGGGGTNPHNKRESDYDLWLDREADVAVDADRQGNEARFVNDYRGTGKSRPNAEFREVWDPRRGERGMGVFVLPAGKRALVSGTPSCGIAKGEEILVSYGKGFWEMRQKEARAKGEEAESEGKGKTAAAAAAASESLDRHNAPAKTPATADTPVKKVDVQSIIDGIGSLKVVAKLPRDPM